MNFSIVIIIKDDPVLLNLALASYAKLDYSKGEFELIVIDDGSSQPLNKLSDFPSNIEINYLYLPRNKLSSRARARNKGAALAKYPYLVFVDGDHFVEPTLLSKYCQYFKCKPKRRLVLGTRNEIPPHYLGLVLNQYNKTGLAAITNKVKWHKDIRLSLEQRFNRPIDTLAGKWHLFWSCNFCIEKELFLNTLFDEKFLGWGLEDVELGYRLTKEAIEFEMLNNAVWHLSSAEQLNKDKYHQWLENIQYFYSKHNDIRILEQQSFSDVFFYEAGLCEKAPLDWLSIFEIFEHKMAFHNQQKDIAST
ncbi:MULTISPECIES: glycosyltransferase family 2 protein [unclassified Agarivorans]|uniref:glycosyltransferase family 2 protein n=1 Tax=unclassified Agarivorans TaxID=2636026 RepID=UPI0026E1BA60|nr:MULTISPECIES: glycosyltransferase [unclassified Agarivorans]MDO6685870.1 glycosyltransferase [Agarivorans sp. 3_MG-2023]MDO6716015.1 glycosyltransferase [Agarivorans sp. 2_MG-2023]